MSGRCTVRFARNDFDTLMGHLFPGDDGEHGAVLLAGESIKDGHRTFLIREVHLAVEHVDYVRGKIGHRALAPQFIHKLITRARDARLVYLAVHNHGVGSGVAFSGIDMHSHETGYPALLQISRGQPVGALVSGLYSMESDIWISDSERLALREAVVVGDAIERLGPTPQEVSISSETHDRQIRMFGRRGQAILTSCKVAIIGLGGIGSLVAEYLGRLGVGHLVLVDSDRVEQSNLSRIVGATKNDAITRTPKVDVARKVILEANDRAEVVTIRDDVAKESVAKELTNCDYLFLAADSMRARLMVNALVHQYLIPGVQLGAKVRANSEGALEEVMSVNRPLRPGRGCLWCNHFIDPYLLALEAKTDAERKEQAYGVEEPNPSVISLNAVAAASAVNDFVLDYLGLRGESEKLAFQHFHHLKRRLAVVSPRKDDSCSECSRDGTRFARGDAVPLPFIEG